MAKSKTSRYTVITKAKLKPGTEFKVYVTAFTAKGEGASSDAVQVNTPSIGEGSGVCFTACNNVLVYLSRYPPPQKKIYIIYI